MLMLLICNAIFIDSNQKTNAVKSVIIKKGNKYELYADFFKYGR